MMNKYEEAFLILTTDIELLLKGYSVNKQKLQEAINTLKKFVYNEKTNDEMLQMQKLMEKQLELDFYTKSLKNTIEAWVEINKLFEIGIDGGTNEVYITGQDYYGEEKTIYSYSEEKQSIEIIKGALKNE